MNCPYCSAETKVIESRETENSTTVRRRRECKSCGKRFTTYERAELRSRVIKKDGTREKFNEEKLKKGLYKACERRPVSDQEIQEIVEEVIEKLRESGKNEIGSSEIGKMAMQKLKELDKVAYIRFASVYKQFDLESLEKEIKSIK
ncbi:MAG: transcriptional regulator NrdR [Candidatus Aenigmatarchaeota archaeon]